MNTLTSSAHLSNVDLDLEAAVLGAVLAEPAKAVEVLRLINKPAVFYKLEHQYIFEAISCLHTQNQSVDLLTVRQWLRQSGYATDSLLELVTENIYTRLAEKCLILIELAYKRFLGEYGQRLHRRALDPTTDALELLQKVDDDIDQLIEGINMMKLPVVGDHVRDFLIELDQNAKSTGPVTGLSMGIRVLDEQTNGLKRGGFYVLAAGTSEGKSALAGHIIKCQLLEHQNPVGLFTLEMKGKVFMSRFVAAETGYSNYELDRGKDLDYSRIQEVAARLTTAPFHIWDKPGIELTQLRYKATEWKRQHDIKLLVIDYLQLIRHSRVNNTYERVSEISRTCKEIAGELDIPVLALSQYNRDHDKREGVQKRPRLSDLRESGQIEQDSDGVMMLLRPYRHGIEYKDGIVTAQTLEIHIPKWRSGVTTLRDEPLLAYYDAPTNRFGSQPFSEVPF